MTLVESIAQAVEQLNEEEAVSLVRKAIRDSLDPLQVLQEGIVAGMRSVGDKFGCGEYFLAELIMGGDIGKKCIEIITPYLPNIPEEAKQGRVVIGTVKSDIHNIGKDLVAMQLGIFGFEVYDIGINAPSMKFIEKAQEVKANIIALSGFLTSTVPNMAEVINYLVDMGIRDQYKVIIGGGITTQRYAESIGADGWGANASEAVDLCQRLMIEVKQAR